jgi:hypothetical protein
LILTEESLVFERAVSWLALARLLPSPNFSVSRREIVDVQRLPGGTSDWVPFIPILGLTLETGEQLFVQVQDVGGWIATLEHTRADKSPGKGATP